MPLSSTRKIVFDTLICIEKAHDGLDSSVGLGSLGSLVLSRQICQLGNHPAEMKD
jgi:hypothetical protein